MSLSIDHARRAGRTLVAAFLLVALAAWVEHPIAAIVICLLAVGAAGELTGLAREAAPRAIGLRFGARPSRGVLALGAVGYLIGLPITWRALHALADLGIDPRSLLGLGLLSMGTASFAIGHRLGAEPSPGRRRPRHCQRARR